MMNVIRVLMTLAGGGVLLVNNLFWLVVIASQFVSCIAVTAGGDPVAGVLGLAVAFGLAVVVGTPINWLGYALVGLASAGEEAPNA